MNYRCSWSTVAFVVYHPELGAMVRPLVMKEAEIDLGGTVSGRFSPEDWDQILARAEARFRDLKAQCEDETKAWQSVVRDFHQAKFWGFVPDYKPPRPPAQKKNLGLSFVWMVFNAMVFSKVLILWYGQLYARSDEAIYKWLFFTLIFAFVANFALFLWRHRHHQDGGQDEVT